MFMNTPDQAHPEGKDHESHRSGGFIVDIIYSMPFQYWIDLVNFDRDLGGNQEGQNLKRWMSV